MGGWCCLGGCRYDWLPLLIPGQTCWKARIMYQATMWDWGIRSGDEACSTLREMCSATGLHEPEAEAACSRAHGRRPALRAGELHGAAGPAAARADLVARWGRADAQRFADLFPRLRRQYDRVQLGYTRGDGSIAPVAACHPCGAGHVRLRGEPRNIAAAPWQAQRAAQRSGRSGARATRPKDVLFGSSL